MEEINRAKEAKKEKTRVQTVMEWMGCSTKKDNAEIMETAACLELLRLRMASESELYHALIAFPFMMFDNSRHFLYTHHARCSLFEWSLFPMASS